MKAAVFANKGGVNIADIFEIGYRSIGGIIISILLGLTIICYLDEKWMFIPAAEAASEEWRRNLLQLYVYGTAAPISLSIAALAYHERRERRRCKACRSAWSRQKTDQAINVERHTYDENETKTEYRGVGDKRQSRTIDLVVTHEVREYDRIYNCVSCDHDDVEHERRTRAIRRQVTATTPWQYDVI